MNVSIRGNIVM